MDGIVKARSISNYLRSASFTRKKINNEPENYPDQRVLEETKEYLNLIQTIPHERRIYMDESFIYDNETPNRGRSLKGQRIHKKRKRHGKQWTIYLAIRLEGIVHDPVISMENATDSNFLEYVRNVLTSSIREGDVVIWDKLGKAGRCKNPQK